MANAATIAAMGAVAVVTAQSVEMTSQRYQVAQSGHLPGTVVHQQQIVIVGRGPSRQAINHQTCSIVIFVVGFIIPPVFWGGTCLMCQPDKTPLARGLNIASIALAILATTAIILAVSWPLMYAALVLGST